MIEIIKNSMVDPIEMTCTDCKSVYTYNYQDIQSESAFYLFGSTYYNRFVTCPVCKCRNYINTTKDPEEN